MSRFDCAAYKLLAGDVRDCQPVGDTQWQVAADSGGVARQLRVVWLQGRLTAVSADRGEATLEDGSGAVQLVDCTQAPGDSQWMKEDQYCMVVGEILSGSPPELSVIKLAPLPDIHRQMWALEVRHARRYLEQAADS